MVSPESDALNSLQDIATLEAVEDRIVELREKKFKMWGSYSGLLNQIISDIVMCLDGNRYNPTIVVDRKIE